MRTVDVFGQKVDLQGSALTLLYYKNEFGGDLVQDLLTDEKAQECMNITVMLQVAWAMAKTVDPLVSDFETWLGQFGDGFTLEGVFDKGSWARRVNEAVTAELFRPKATGKTTKN